MGHWLVGWLCTCFISSLADLIPIITRSPFSLSCSSLHSLLLSSLASKNAACALGLLLRHLIFPPSRPSSSLSSQLLTSHPAIFAARESAGVSAVIDAENGHRGGQRRRAGQFASFVQALTRHCLLRTTSRHRMYDTRHPYELTLAVRLSKPTAPQAGGLHPYSTALCSPRHSKRRSAAS
jgi:hypothetical protein